MKDTWQRNIAVSDFMPAGTNTGSGRVVWHDMTRYNLGRLCIETSERYPDLETWCQAVTGAGKDIKGHRYTDRAGKAGLIGYLWIYYK